MNVLDKRAGVHDCVGDGCSGKPVFMAQFMSGVQRKPMVMDVFIREPVFKGSRCS